MRFSTKDLALLVPGSTWKYTETMVPYNPSGNTDYLLIEQTERDVQENRQGIQDLSAGYVHNLRRFQILEWFIPFDKKFRDDAVRLAVILTQLKISEIPPEELQEMLIKLEV